MVSVDDITPVEESYREAHARVLDGFAMRPPPTSIVQEAFDNIDPVAQERVDDMVDRIELLDSHAVTTA